MGDLTHISQVHKLNELEKPIRTRGPATLKCRGRLLSLDIPKVVGILNLTPDSFSDGGKFTTVSSALSHVETMVEEGAAIIDIGGYSSRPGAEDISVEEELERIEKTTAAILERYPDTLVSIDTFRPEVAERMLDLGVHIINDIFGGTYDARMLNVVAANNAAYIVMHMQGNPRSMQKNPQYEDVFSEVFEFLTNRIEAARNAGITDLIIDPGFGFGKTVDHNYELFRNLHRFSLAAKPMMIGISRKSMLYKRFGGGPDSVGELSAALHLQALFSGAKLLRVHDVKIGTQLVQLYQNLKYGAV